MTSPPTPGPERPRPPPGDPVDPTGPPGRRPPKPGGPTTPPPAGATTLTGTVRAGVEPDCLLLDGYLLVGGPRDVLTPGARVDGHRPGPARPDDHLPAGHAVRGGVRPPRVTSPSAWSIRPAPSVSQRGVGSVVSPDRPAPGPAAGGAPARPAPASASSSSETPSSASLRALTSTRASSEPTARLYAVTAPPSDAAELADVVAQRGQPAVQLAGQRVHRQRVAGQRLLPPRVGDRAQQRDQRGRGGQHHVAGERVLQQRRVALQRRRRGTGRPARTAPRTRASGRTPPSTTWRPARRRAPRRCRACASRWVSRPRSSRASIAVRYASNGAFASTTTVPAAVQPDHQVGADALVVGGGGDLLGEVAVLQHAGRLDDAAQLVLAPAAPHLRRAQRGHQLLGLGAQLAGDGAHRPDLLAQLGVGVDPVALQLGDPLLVAAQGVVQRRDRPGHRLLGLGGGLVAAAPASTAPAGPRPPGWPAGWPPAGRCRWPRGTGRRASPARRRRRGRRSPRPASRSPCPELARRVRRDARWVPFDDMEVVLVARPGACWSARCVVCWRRGERSPGRRTELGRRPRGGPALVRAARRPGDEPARRRPGGPAGAGRRG